MHETIEQMLRSGKITKIPPPIIPPSDIDFDNSPEIIKREDLLELREYLSRNHLEQVEIEIPVFDNANLICSCIDAIFRNSETGELSIWDWKRKKQTVMTPQIRAQLNLNKHIYELCGKNISKLFVCNIYSTMV